MDLLAGPAAIGALQANLHDLRDQLAQSGLKLDDVSLRQADFTNADAGANGRNAPREGPDPSRENGSRQRGAGGGVGGIDASAAPRPIRPVRLGVSTGGSGLDVLI